MREIDYVPDTPDQWRLIEGASSSSGSKDRKRLDSLWRRRREGRTKVEVLHLEGQFRPLSLTESLRRGKFFSSQCGERDVGSRGCRARSFASSASGAAGKPRSRERLA